MARDGTACVEPCAASCTETRGGDALLSIRAVRHAVATALAASLLAFGVAGAATVQAATRSGRATFGPLTDITKRAGNEAETAVAIQQTNTNHVTVLSNIG